MPTIETTPNWSDYPEMKRVGNAEMLWSHFGYWPKFHDAEIIRFAFETKPEWCYSIQVWIEAFEMLNETDEKGYYKTAKECTVEIEFIDLSKLDFKWFSYQNVISVMSIQEKDDLLECIIDSSAGMEAEIMCKEIKVVSLTPRIKKNLEYPAS